MSEQKCRKVYVPVNLDVDAEGNIRPRLIRWIDGRVYEIDRLKHKCRAASTKVGGCGIRYTVMIGEHESFLYNEDENGSLKQGAVPMILSQKNIEVIAVAVIKYPIMADWTSLDFWKDCMT